MTNKALKIALLACSTLAFSCARSGDSKSPGAAAFSTKPRQLGMGSQTCPFQASQETYAIEVPRGSGSINSLPAGKYLLSQVRTNRSELSMDGWQFANGAKIIFAHPGQFAANDAIQALITKQVGLTEKNLTFPLSLTVADGKASWDRVVGYEPSISLSGRLAIEAPKMQEVDSKEVAKSPAQFSFGVFAHRNLGGYATIVNWSEEEVGFATGYVVPAKDGANLVISMQRGTSDGNEIRTVYELQYKLESAARPSSCGKASALRIEPAK